MRHEHSCLNVLGKGERLRGWLDIPLDNQGLREAAETAERLADYPVESIYSSDVRRAEALRRRTHALRVTTTRELRPWNLGVFCNERVMDIFLNLLNQHSDLSTPSGEFFYQFYGRYSRLLTELMNLALGSSRWMVTVTHVRNCFGFPDCY